MKFIIWTRDDILKLTTKQKAMWFDVYNNNLFIDSDLDITTMSDNEIHTVYKNLQQEYYNYIDSLLIDSLFVFYLILEDEDFYLSQLRVIIRDGFYTIEGFETHRDHHMQGHGSFLISEALRVCKEVGITEVYANIYTKNNASYKSFIKNGFKEVNNDVEGRKRVVKRLA